MPIAASPTIWEMKSAILKHHCNCSINGKRTGRLLSRKSAAPGFRGPARNHYDSGYSTRSICQPAEAFRQDQTVTRYQTFDDLLGYCLNSANPVGHLVLYLCGYRDAERQKLSDFTCTALQLANFWQDVSDGLRQGPHLSCRWKICKRYASQ